jgi:hypothetical protein
MSFYFETGSHSVAKLALILQSSCLILLTTEIIDMYRYAQPGWPFLQTQSKGNDL